MLPTKLIELQSRHPSITYHSFSLLIVDHSLRIDYHFILAPDIAFSHSIEIPSLDKTINPLTTRLAFLLGLVELISYWKLACPTTIEILAGELSATEVSWWENLYRQGLGEFFYLNKIPQTINFEFLVSQPNQTHEITFEQRTLNGALILIGGGKDSIVTLTTLNTIKEIPTAPFCVNPINASLEAIEISGYPDSFIAKRKIDPQLISLNKQGYLNGHTPYSAFLAFVATLTAYQNGFSLVLASNETSASEGNASVDGIEVNHQYSKSFDFESRFRNYPFGFTCPVEYLSYLRPLNELQICAIFAKQSDFLSVFRSCNREQTAEAKARFADGILPENKKRSGWCGECPKCVFTALCLACFLNPEEIAEIFGISPFDGQLFYQIAHDLAGRGKNKPFECVGTYHEVRSSLTFLSNRSEWLNRYPDLLTRLAMLSDLNLDSFSELLRSWDHNNFLSPILIRSLRNALASAQEGRSP